MRYSFEPLPVRGRAHQHRGYRIQQRGGNLQSTGTAGSDPGGAGTARSTADTIARDGIRIAVEDVADMRAVALLFAGCSLLLTTGSPAADRSGAEQALKATELARLALSTPTEVQMKDGVRIIVLYEMSVIDDLLSLTEHWRRLRPDPESLAGSEKVITRMLSVDLRTLSGISLAGGELTLTCADAIECVKGMRAESRECPVGKELCLRTSTMERESRQSLVLGLADDRAARNATIAFNILQRIHSAPDVENPADFVTRLYRDDLVLPNNGLDVAAPALASLMRARLASTKIENPSIEWALQGSEDAPIEAFRVLDIDQKTAEATVYVTYSKNGEPREKSVSLALEGERWLITDVCWLQGCFTQALQEEF